MNCWELVNCDWEIREVCPAYIKKDQKVHPSEKCPHILTRKYFEKRMGEKGVIPAYVLEEESIPNCWDVVNCDQDTREKCTIYINDIGRECWMVTGTMCDESGKIISFTDKMKKCRKCDFFIKYAKRPY